MLASLLPVALAARATHADGSLPPVAVVIRRRGALTGAEPITATLETHPRLRALLDGARRTRTGWAMPARHATNVLEAIGTPWKAAGRIARVAPASTGIRLTVHHDDTSPLAALTAHPGQPAAMTAADAHALVDYARRHHVPAFTAAPAADLKVVDEDANNTVVATCPPGMPSAITISGPAAAVAKLTLPAPHAPTSKRAGSAVWPAAKLASLKAPAGVRLLWRADAADALAVASAAPARLPGPALHPWQSQFAGRYAASRRGLVNALPPGLGKSAAALAALRAHHHNGIAIRALVLAPASSRHQWLDEATRFFPEARVLDAGTGCALTEALTTDAADACLVLTTPDLLASTTSAGAWTDVVVDEATFLTQTDSRRAQAAWAARRDAQRGMPLTGTPRPRRLADLEALVCFALGDPHLFNDLPLAGYACLDAAARVDAFVHTHAAPTPAARADHSTPALVPSATEQALDALVRERIADLAGRTVSATTLATLLKAARLGYTDPAALLSSSYQLGRDLAAHLPAREAAPPTGTSTKIRYTVDEVLRRVHSGQQVLVAADFLEPLATLTELLRTELGSDAVHPVTSKVAPKTREKRLAAFAAGDVKVLLLSGTAHLGLNLQAASAVIHLDVPATAALLTQRAARSARLGSTRTSIDSVLPVLEGTVEDRLADLIGARGLRPADREDEAAFVARLATPPVRAAA